MDNIWKTMIRTNTGVYNFIRIIIMIAGESTTMVKQDNQPLMVIMMAINGIEWIMFNYLHSLSMDTTMTNTRIAGE